MKAIILVGIPYSGKSTYCKKLKDCVVVSSDDKITKYAEITERSYSEVFQEYIEIATKKSDIDFYEAINSKKDIVIDKTNMTRKGRAKWISPLLKAGYEIECVVFEFPSGEELEKRIGMRIDKVISYDIINKMKASYQEPDISEGFHLIKVIRN